MKMKLNFQLCSRKKHQSEARTCSFRENCLRFYSPPKTHPPRRPKRANKSICQFAHVRRKKILLSLLLPHIYELFDAIWSKTYTIASNGVAVFRSRIKSFFFVYSLYNKIFRQFIMNSYPHEREFHNLSESWNENSKFVIHLCCSIHQLH